MREIAHEQDTSIRERLERLLDLDYEESHSQLRTPESPDFSDLENRAARPVSSKRKTWAAFLLGVGVPVLISLWIQLIPQLQNAMSAQDDSPVPAATYPGFNRPNQNMAAQETLFAKVPEMTAQRSTITGIVDPATLSASYYWTMILTNHSTSSQEAQMEFILPKGAAVSRATLWMNGREEEAAFNSTWKVQQAYDWIVRLHRDPLLVTQQPDGRILVKMSPVPSSGTPVKLRIGITAPLTLHGEHQTSFTLPAMTRSNFAFECRQDIHLQSTGSMQVNNTSFATNASQGAILLRGSIMPSDIRGLEIQAERATNMVRFATRATHSLPGSFIVGSLQFSSDSGDTGLNLKKVIGRPDCPVVSSEDAAFRLSTLWAAREIDRLMGTSPNTAVDLGIAYRVVSPVTGAVVLETESDYQAKGLHRNQYQTLSYAPASGSQTQQGSMTWAHASGSQTLQGSMGSAPMLQGATNGTIGPEGADANVMMGVNTAGTVRVEPLSAIISMAPHDLTPLAGGLSYWLTASPRDANLFGGEENPTPDPGQNLPFVLVTLFFVAMNLALPLFLLGNSALRAVKHKPGAKKALIFGLLWLVLAVLSPDLSIMMALAFLLLKVFLKRKRPLLQEART